MDPEQRLRRGLLMHAINASPTTTRLRAQIDELLRLDDAYPRARFALGNVRSRAQLRALVTELEVAVRDLCADLGPCAAAEATRLAHTADAPSDPDLLLLGANERSRVIQWVARLGR